MPAMHAKGASGPWADPGEASVAILWIEEMALSKAWSPGACYDRPSSRGFSHQTKQVQCIINSKKAALKENC